MAPVQERKRTAKRDAPALCRFGGDALGATAIEYAVIAALVSTVIVAALPAIGHGLSDMMAPLLDGF